MANKLPPLPVGVAPGSGYWNDWYEKLRTLINSFAAGFPFSSITSLPTTLSGYGITDGVANSRTINTTAPLTGGGDLSANRTLAITEFAGSTPGSVPTSAGGTTNFLRADGSWAAPSGGGGGGSSLTQVAATNANVSMATNSLYILDASILTANRTYTLPATAAVGDRVGIALPVGSASYEVLITAAAGDTLNGIAGGTEWTRLFQAGEIVILQCTVADTTWVTDTDGRIAQVGRMGLITTDITTSTAGAWNASDFNEATIAKGCIVTVSGAGTSTIKVRRNNNYVISGAVLGKNGVALADQEQFGWACTANGNVGVGTVLCAFSSSRTSGTANQGTSGVISAVANAGDLLQHNFYWGTTANAGMRALNYASWLSVVEVL